MQNDHNMSVATSLKVNNIPLLEELSDEAASVISGGRDQLPLETVINPWGLDDNKVRLYPDGTPIGILIDLSRLHTGADLAGDRDYS